MNIERVREDVISAKRTSMGRQRTQHPSG